MSSRVSLLLAAGCLIHVVLPFAAHGQQDQWEFWASNDSASTKFDTENEAADKMRAGTNWRDPFLTVRGPIVYQSWDRYEREWSVAPVPTTVSAWEYSSYVAGGAWLPAYEDAKAAAWGVITSAVCGNYFTIVGESSWVVTHTYLGAADRMEKTIYYNSSYWAENGDPPGCLPFSTNPHSFVILARRTVACPSGWSYDTVLGKCVLTHTRRTIGRLITCGPVQGNPCAVTNGSKLLRETDYAGPGIELTRVFNSQSDATWKHNFSDYLVIWGTSNVFGAVRADGYQEPMKWVGSDKWISYSGSGQEVRKVGTEWVLYYPSGAKEYFNITGKLLRRENQLGQTTTVNRDAAGNITSIAAPFGHTLTFSYDADGRLEMVEDPDGNDIVYEYDSSNRLVTVGYQDGTERNYHYEDVDFPLFVTGITDENSDRYATYTYDDDGRVTVSEHAGGYGRVELAYTASATSVTDGESNVTQYSFTTSATQMRKPVSITVGGATKTYTYPSFATDNQQRPTQITHENGAISKFTYDTYHKTSETEAFGTAQARTLNFYYLDETSQRLTRVTSPSVKSGSLKEIETTYSGTGLPIAIEESGYTPPGTAVSRTTNLDYNASGQVIEIDGPRTDVSDVTTIDYYTCTTGDECGQLESVTNAAGHVTTYDAYDAHGRLLQMTDPNGLLTAYEYDLRGRLTTLTETPPSGPVRVTAYDYDDAGLLESVATANGTVLTYAYDEAHNLISITDNLGNSIEYGYDLNGNRTDEDIYDSSSNLKKTIEYTYDARDRIDTINSAGSLTDLVFDALGNLTDETDPNANDTEHEYDPLARLKKTIDALSGETEYGYDKNDMLTSVEAPNGATTAYVYDDMGNLLSTTSPDTGTTTFTYDAAGNRLSQTDANSVTVNYSYDELNRLTDIDYPGSTLDVGFTFDQGTNQKGQLTTMVDGSGTTTFEYDVFGNLTEESRIIGGNTHVTAYSYDEADLLESITYPSGRTVDYTRNVLGQVTDVETTYAAATTTVADGIAYEPFGPLAELTFGNGLAMSRTFDQQYRLGAQTTGAIQDVEFTLDGAGNIDEIADGVNASLSQEFTQDALHRVDWEDGAYGANAYTYDANGNRLTKVQGLTTQTLTYTANSNRLATHNGNAVTRDAAGNTTADLTENLAFTYGSHNRMLAVYVGAVLKASYAYNGQGQRVTKVEATGAQRTMVYHYGPGGELLGETVYSSAGAEIGERDYIWLDSLPLAQSERVFSSGVVTSSQFVYLHTDQLNTPRLATNGAQTVVWRWDSDAFGIGAANTDPDADTSLVNVRLRFPGQYLDEESGQHYNYLRDYDPVTGRYLEADPIGLAGGIGTYGYADGNPLGNTDPTGEFANVVVGAVTGVATGYAIALLTGDKCYGVDDALKDAALGTVGAGLLSKANKLYRIAQLRNVARGRGLKYAGRKDYTETWKAENSLERLKIKHEAGKRPGLQAGSRVPRYEYRVGAGRYWDPFTDGTGPAGALSHVPLEPFIPVPSAVAGALSGTVDSGSLCGCER